MCAVPSTTVFCSFFNSCLPVVLLVYFMNDFEVVPVAPVISGKFFALNLLLLLLLLLLLFIMETREIVCTHDADDDDDDAVTG